jgi:hypothetical protein
MKIEKPKNLLLGAALLLPLCLSLHAQAAPASSPMANATVLKPVKLWAPLQDKNFYLLSLMEKTPGVLEALASDAVLKKLAGSYSAKLTTGFNGGVPSAEAIPTLLWTQADIDIAAEALRSLYRTNNAVKNMVDGALRQSGMYERFAAEAGDELLVKAWRSDAGGINHVVRVYGLGEAPHYPKIDSAFYDVKSTPYGEITNLIFGVLAEDDSAHQLFFQPSLRAALALMDANRRDEAARFEPMELGENAAALKRVSTVAWDKYPYALILAPGHGPEEPQVQLSPKAKLQMAAIARRYREGKAPFIMVSGGYVHPSQTPFCEAIEMKKSLMNDYGVPENAIFIDPHARHTTTNMRNVARLIYRYGLPAQKSSLITSTPAQIRAINAPKFQQRCARELGYQPAKYGKQLSPLDLEFWPLRDSLQIDPTDPLDP